MEAFIGLLLLELMDDDIQQTIHMLEEEEEHKQDLAKLLAFYTSRLPRLWKPRVQFFVESTVTHFNEKDFRDIFRVSRPKALFLTDLLFPDYNSPTATVSAGRPKIDPFKQVLVALFYLGNNHTILQIANLFGISESTVHTIVHSV